MRHKKLKLSAVFLLGLGLTSIQAQTLYVKETGGIQTSYVLSNISKMTSSGGNVTVQKTDNSTAVYALSEVRYLNFTDFWESIKEQDMPISNASFRAYPNPVTNVLNIDLTGIANGGTISILTIEGKVLQEQKNDGKNSVTFNFSQLPQGIYLCRYVSRTEIKTIKIIKQ